MTTVGLNCLNREFNVSLYQSLYKLINMGPLASHEPYGSRVSFLRCRRTILFEVDSNR